ncbi:MAG: hypothetical protein JOZ37_12655 [Actinobacteria bacterium]|nr:hypothetical protein [Actinomycetota bacterium]MBV8957200.1 hypothetical protein [Actinomycetota bacterium]MBV9255479.1 hypothetical protein [Actinomycetota bacterium]MBV9664810.1 hypothetical protein [Actinomycetota bacterium]MBV9935358.1 hypothetical protein [Actinomycetota bacterium]
MARPKSTFAKLDRERANQMKAKAKLERRRAKADEPAEPAEEETSAEEQAAIIESLAALQETFDAGRMSLEDFEAYRDELRAKIRI